MIRTARQPIAVLGALCGILSPILSFGGFMLIGAAGFAVQPGASRDDVAQIVAQPAPPLAFTGLTLDVLGSLAFVLFAGRLWGTLREAEGTPAWLSRVHSELRCSRSPAASSTRRSSPPSSANQGED
jgi:hypothetical protein